MEILVRLDQKTQERSGEKDGRPWKFAGFLGTIQGGRDEKVLLDVQDGESGRIAQFESNLGKVVSVSYTIEARQGSNGYWYNTIRGWSAREV